MLTKYKKMTPVLIAAVPLWYKLSSPVCYFRMHQKISGVSPLYQH